MNFTEEFEQVLNSKKHEFLMYRPGTGGEKLVTLIYKYSSKYKGDFNDYNQIDSKNQTIIDYPAIYYYLFQTPQITNDKNILDTAIKKIEYNEISHLREFLNKFNDIVLLRCHPVFHSYFSGHTCMITEDNEHVLKYSFYLNILKTARRDKNEVVIRAYKMYLRHHHDQPESKWEEIKKIILNHNADHVYSHAVSLFFSLPPENQSLSLLQELLGKSENYINKEMYNILCTQQFTDYIYDTAKLFNYEQFPMSDYFIDGKLEQRFDIVDSNFRKEINHWHEKNLELLDANNIDYTEFNF